MTPSSIDQLAVREVRVQEHLHTADLLYQDGNEWAAVAYFYAAYHQMRVAFLEDPIFDDATALQGIHLKLQKSDRDADHHQGSTRPGGRSFGVSDIVLWVYRRFNAEYRRLHSASVDVRYETGLNVIPLETTRGDAYEIRNAYLSGLLNHANAGRS